MKMFKIFEIASKHLQVFFLIQGLIYAQCGHVNWRQATTEEEKNSSFLLSLSLSLSLSPRLTERASLTNSNKANQRKIREKRRTRRKKA